MIRMTPKLQAALERFTKKFESERECFDIRDLHAIVDAVRAAPQVEGKWDATRLGRWEWVVGDGSRAIYVSTQREAEMYRDYLNAADAALESRG